MSSQPTSSQPTSGQTPAVLKTPQVGEKDRIVTFLEERCKYESWVRFRRASLWTKAGRYWENMPWGVPAGNRDPRKTPHWSDVQFNDGDDDRVPMPRQPEIVVCLQNEAARLGRPDYKPYVSPDSAEADIKARDGAKLGEQVLAHELDAMNWENIEAEGDFHMPLFGQAIYRSLWEEDLLDTVRLPVISAVACPRNPKAFATPPAENPETPVTAGGGLSSDAEGPAPSVDSDISPLTTPAQPLPSTCDFVSAKPQIPVDQTLAMDPTLLAPMQPSGYSLKGCPDCPDHPPLVPFAPNLDEARDGQDSFGRPLGEDKPKGKWVVQVVSPFDTFMQSQGVGVKFSGTTWREFAVPTSLGYIRSHYAEGWKVQPDRSEIIMRWHPVLGQAGMYGGGADAGVFEDFAILRTYIEEPTPLSEPDPNDPTAQRQGFPMGRYIVTAGKTILMDTTLMVPSQTAPGEMYSREHDELIEWEQRPWQAFGVSLFEWLEGIQDSILQARSLEQDHEERMGMVGFTAPRSMNVDVRALTQGGFNGKLIEFDSDPNNPNSAIGTLGGSKDQGGFEKIKFLIDSMQRIAGTSDPESRGAPPSGVTAAIALQLLANESGGRRDVRLRRKRDALVRLFSHGLSLNYHRAMDPRVLNFKDTDGKNKQRQWEGIEINGQCKVRIDIEPQHDTPIAKKQQLLDALEMGLYGPVANMDAATRDSIIEKLGGARDLGATTGLQKDRAAQEFVDYIENGDEPVVDVTLDDAASHVAQHGKDMLSDRFLDLEAACGWKAKMAPVLWDWKVQFPAIMATINMAQQKMAQTQGQPPPPPLVFLEAQIIAVWSFMLEKAGVGAALQPTMGNEDSAKAAAKVLRMRAHLEAHKLVGEGQMELAAAQPTIAAPEAPGATAAGTVATPGQPPAGMPQPGNPPGAPPSVQVPPQGMPAPAGAPA